MNTDIFILAPIVDPFTDNNCVYGNEIRCKANKFLISHLSASNSFDKKLNEKSLDFDINVTLADPVMKALEMLRSDPDQRMTLLLLAF